ncbi:hypothetical protein, partial [Pseudomonas syringae]
LRVGTHFVTLCVISKPSGKCLITHNSGFWPEAVGRTGRRFADPLLPVGRRSELVRDLPGTGSKTCAPGTSGSNEVTSFRAASQPIVAVFTY